MTARTQTGDRTARSDGGTDDRPPMKDVSHTDSESAASLHRLYTRGEHVVADGGHAGARERANGDREDDEERREEMREVDHTGSDDTDPNKVFERGGEFDDEE